LFLFLHINEKSASSRRNNLIGDCHFVILRVYESEENLVIKNKWLNDGHEKENNLSNAIHEGTRNVHVIWCKQSFHSSRGNGKERPRIVTHVICHILLTIEGSCVREINFYNLCTSSWFIWITSPGQGKSWSSLLQINVWHKCLFHCVHRKF